MILPGTPTIPDQIVDQRIPYYHALDTADAAWQAGQIDVSNMQSLIESYLQRQLS